MSANGKPGLIVTRLKAQANGVRRARTVPPARLIRGNQLAILLAALLAFTWQSFVTQTHVHPAPHAPVSAIAGQPVAVSTHAAEPGSSDQPASCPICQEIAHSGAYLLPAPFSIHIPGPVTLWLSLAVLMALAVRQTSHRWQSRAPPLHLSF